MDKSAVVDWLKQSAKTMGADSAQSDEARSLRRLQSLMNRALFADVPPDIRFLAFVINAYVQSVFTDLLGDIPDDSDGILLNIRRRFLDEVCEGLREMIVEFEKGGVPINALEKLVESYATAINKLNQDDIRLEGRR